MTSPEVDTARVTPAERRTKKKAAKKPKKTAAKFSDSPRPALADQPKLLIQAKLTDAVQTANALHLEQPVSTSGALDAVDGSREIAVSSGQDAGDAP